MAWTKNLSDYIWRRGNEALIFLPWVYVIEYFLIYRMDCSVVTPKWVHCSREQAHTVNQMENNSMIGPMCVCIYMDKEFSMRGSEVGRVKTKQAEMMSSIKDGTVYFFIFLFPGVVLFLFCLLLKN